MKELSKSYVIPLLVVSLILILPVSRGQHLGAIASFILVSVCLRFQFSKWKTGAVFLFFALFYGLTTNFVYVQESHVNAFASWLIYERVLVFTFFFVVFLFLNREVFKDFAAITSIVAFSLFVETHVISLFASLIGVTRFEYFDFVMSQQEFEILKQTITDELNPEQKTNYINALDVAKKYIGSFNALISTIYFVSILKFTPSFFLTHNYSFRQFKSHPILIYLLLITWAALLITKFFGFNPNPALSDFIIGVLIVSFFLFFLQGLAIIFYFLAKFGQYATNADDSTDKQNNKGRMIIVMVGLALLSFIFLFIHPLAPIAILFFVISMGLMDMWFDYRRFKKQKND